MIIIIGLVILVAAVVVGMAAAAIGQDARRGLKQSRRETAAVSQDRDDLIDQRDAARGHTVNAVDNSNSPADDIHATTSSPAE